MNITGIFSSALQISENYPKPLHAFSFFDFIYFLSIVHELSFSMTLLLLIVSSYLFPCSNLYCIGICPFQTTALLCKYSFYFVIADSASGSSPHFNVFKTLFIVTVLRFISLLLKTCLHQDAFFAEDTIETDQGRTKRRLTNNVGIFGFYLPPGQ